MRNFLILWFGQIVSIFGSSLASFAVGVWIYEQTGSATLFALAAFFAVLPGVVLSPIAGVLADRWDRRKLMLFADLGASLGTLAMLGLLWTDRLEAWTVYLAILWITTFDAFQRPAFLSSPPLLVAKEKLGQASGLVEMGPALSRALAPLTAGALLVSVGLEAVLWIDFATFFVAAASLLIVRIPRLAKQRPPGAEEPDFLREAAAGWRFIQERRGLLHFLFLMAGFQVVFGMVLVLTGPMVLGYGTPMTLGVIQSASGLGMLLGGGVMSLWGGPKRKVPAVLVFLMIQGFTISLLGLRPDTLLISLGIFGMLFCFPLASGISRVLWQIKVPPELQGRVFSFRMAVTMSMTPIAYLAAGPLADYVFNPLMMPEGALADRLGPILGTGEGRGIGLLLVILGVMTVLAAAVALLLPRFRRLEDDLPDAIPERPPAPEEAAPEAAAAPAAVALPPRPREDVMSSLIRDFRYGLRTLIRSPASTFVILLTLALGLGATAAIFTVTTSVLFGNLPYEEPHRMTILTSLRFQGDRPQLMPMSYRDYQDWTEQGPGVFEQSGVYSAQSFNLLLDGEARHVGGELTSASYFSVLGIEPEIGRVFAEDEAREGNPAQVAILGYSLWRDVFSSDRGVVGQTVRLSGRGYEIVGVMPAGYKGMTDQAEVWVPVSMAPVLKNPQFLEERRFRWLLGIARLAPDVGVPAAREAMDIVSERLAAAYPDTNKDVQMGILPMAQTWFRNLRGALLSLSAGALFVLFIAIINVGSIQVGRALARRREIAMRKALGAESGQILRQLIIESLILALAGGVLGLLVAHLGVRLLLSSGAVTLKRFVEVGFNPLALVAVIAVTILAGLIFGLAPAWVVTRTRLLDAVKEGGRGGGGQQGGRRFQNLVVIGETALALALLINAGVMLKSFQNLQNLDLGFEPENLLTLRLDVEEPRYQAPEALAALVNDLSDRLPGLPGVESLTISTPTLPTDQWFLRDFALERNPQATDEDNKVLMEVHHVGPEYFATLGVEPSSGRVLDRRDTIDAAPAVVVSEDLARRFWPGEDPIGQGLKPFRGPPDAAWSRVVGVVPKVRYRGRQSLPMDPPHVYFSLLQEPPRPTRYINILARGTPGGGSDLSSLIRNELGTIAPGLPPYDVKTVTQRLEDQMANPGFLTLLGVLFAALALVLAAVGVYGIVSFSVTRQQRDIAIRMAIGARRGEVLKTLLVRSARLAGIGILIGGLGSLALTRFLETILFEVSPADPLTFVGTALLLLVVAIVASLIPAVRAIRVNPADLLHGE